MCHLQHSLRYTPGQGQTERSNFRPYHNSYNFWWTFQYQFAHLCSIMSKCAFGGFIRLGQWSKSCELDELSLDNLLVLSFTFFFLNCRVTKTSRRRLWSRTMKNLTRPMKIGHPTNTPTTGSFNNQENSRCHTGRWVQCYPKCLYFV